MTFNAGGGKNVGGETFCLNNISLHLEHVAYCSLCFDSSGDQAINGEAKMVFFVNTSLIRSYLTRENRHIVDEECDLGRAPGEEGSVDLVQTWVGVNERK